MIAPTDCILIMGTRGTGKSFLCQNIQRLWPRRVVIDSLDEYKGEDAVSSFSAFAEKLAQFDRENRKSFVLVFKFDPESDTDQIEFDHIMRLCYYFGKIQVVIEEVQLYSSPHSIPKWLKNCLLTGRHKGLSLIFTTQRPGELSKTVLSQCNHIFCGRLVEGNDVRYVSGFLNQSAERLSSLPDRRFLYFSRGTVVEIENSEAVAR